jgi:hypothetical protein
LRDLKDVSKLILMEGTSSDLKKYPGDMYIEDDIEGAKYS